MKEQKGITLVALVITIIVLLILAGVSITTLTDTESGVIAKAKKAAEETKKATEEEEKYMEELLDYVQTGHLLKFEVVEINGKVKTYYADVGMTWKSWGDSEYNVDGYLCNGLVADSTNGLVADSTGKYQLSEDELYNSPQRAYDYIKDNFTYYQTPYAYGPMD